MGMEKAERDTARAVSMAAAESFLILSFINQTSFFMVNGIIVENADDLAV